MSIPLNRFRWLAPLLAAMAFALAPQFAAAHGRHADDPGGPGVAVPLAADHAAPVPGRAAERSAPAIGSSSCPSGHGNSCCCRVPAACAGAGQAPVVSCGGWVRPFSLPAGHAARLPVAPLPHPQFAQSPALPRAPPPLS